MGWTNWVFDSIDIIFQSSVTKYDLLDHQGE